MVGADRVLQPAVRGVRRLVGPPALWLRRRVVDEAQDRMRGTRTARWTELEELGLAAPDRVRYVPSPWAALGRVLPRREVSERDVFVDFGAGMGRVVLAAAGYPFRRVVGVELSAELAEVARRNVERRRDRLVCPDVRIVACDATEFEVPDDLTVAYFFNPFRGAIFRTVVDRLIASVDASPRVLRIVYLDPFEERALLDTGRVRLVRSARGRRPGREWSRRHSVHLYELTP